MFFVVEAVGHFCAPYLDHRFVQGLLFVGCMRWSSVVVRLFLVLPFQHPVLLLMGRGFPFELLIFLEDSSLDVVLCAGTAQDTWG